MPILFKYKYYAKYKNKITKIISLNLLQNFVAKCYNGIIKDIIKITKKNYKNKGFILYIEKIDVKLYK
jgi:hypothetical protein